MLCVVFPVGIAVGVVDRVQRLSEGSCGVGILALCQDISALVICPYIGLSRVVVILPHKLRKGIVGIVQLLNAVFVDAYKVSYLFVTTRQSTLHTIYTENLRHTRSIL